MKKKMKICEVYKQTIKNTILRGYLRNVKHIAKSVKYA